MDGFYTAASCFNGQFFYSRADRFAGCAGSKDGAHSGFEQQGMFFLWHDAADDYADVLQSRRGQRCHQIGHDQVVSRK